MKMFPEQALRATEIYCERRVPADLRDSLRIECSRRGNAITIVERRPPWRPDEAELEWTATKVAQLSFDPASELWSLRCPDSNGRWHSYPEALVDSARSLAGQPHLADGIDRCRPGAVSAFPRFPPTMDSAARPATCSAGPATSASGLPPARRRQAPSRSRTADDAGPPPETLRSRRCRRINV